MGKNSIKKQKRKQWDLEEKTENVEEIYQNSCYYKVDVTPYFAMIQQGIHKGSKSKKVEFAFEGKLHNEHFKFAMNVGEHHEKAILERFSGLFKQMMNEEADVGKCPKCQKDNNLYDTHGVSNIKYLCIGCYFSGPGGSTPEQ